MRVLAHSLLEVADTKYTADVRPLFQLAKQVAGKGPEPYCRMARQTSMRPTLWENSSEGIS